MHKNVLQYHIFYSYFWDIKVQSLFVCSKYQAEVLSTHFSLWSFLVWRHRTQLWCCYLDWRHAPGDPGSVVWWCGRRVRSVRCPGRWPTAAGLSASLLSFHPAPGLYSPPLREGDGLLDERRRKRRRLGAEEEKKSHLSFDLSVQLRWHLSSLWKQFIQMEIKILRVKETSSWKKNKLKQCRGGRIGDKRGRGIYYEMNKWHNYTYQTHKDYVGWWQRLREYCISGVVKDRYRFKIFVQTD